MRNAIKMLGLVSALVLSACGGDKGDDLGRFIGTWQPTSGTVTEVCPGYTFNATLTSTTWRAGLSSDLVSTDALGACSLTADVAGSTASGTPGTSCANADGTFRATFNSYTFVVSPDGHTASENASGTMVYVDGGATIPCSFNETGSYQKISN